MAWRFDPRHLRTLEAVVRLGSFPAAAHELGYTQSAVSQQIAELERQVRTRVVTRRPVRPTESGRVLLEAEAGITAAMSGAAIELDALAEGTAGEVRLGAFISAAASVVPPALARLRVTHPGVHITLHEVEQSETHARLLRGELDLALTFDYEHAPDPPPAGLVRAHLMDDPIMVVLPAEHPSAGRRDIDPADLPGTTWIDTAVAVGDRRPSPDGERANESPGVDFEGQDFRTALNLVSAGLGVALLPRLLLLDAPATVVVLPMRDPKLVRRIYTCRPDTRGTSMAIRQLIAYLRESAADL